MAVFVAVTLIAGLVAFAIIAIPSSTANRFVALPILVGVAMGSSYRLLEQPLKQLIQLARELVSGAPIGSLSANTVSRIQVYKDRTGGYRYRLVAKDGRVLNISPQYASPDEAIDAVNAMLDVDRSVAVELVC
ncbi:hypothetical protein [Pseudonocardia spinosispora]|uniref:hypothetical protein n=1 Tax=Pseudonocardia spinosispora TaxID=103441 RepID=UPI0012EBE1F4|nr:hypothetical protein [Pseudonocardia spinosispora]